MLKTVLSTLLLLAMAASANAQSSTDCGCGDPLDLVVLVDRSASISISDYNDARLFAHDFVHQFTVSPELTNVAILQFEEDAELALALDLGFSLLNVDAALNSMSCGCSDTLDFDVRPWEVPPSRETCCARRSSISRALDRASVLLAGSLRPNACKAVLVISDGAHNTLRDGVTPCNGAECAADLTSAIQDLAADHPGLALAGVGTGSTDHWKMALIDGGRFGGLTSDLPTACPPAE